jgi:hypothetical protein
MQNQTKISIGSCIQILLYQLLFDSKKNLINHTILFGFFSSHPIIAIRIFLHFLVWIIRMLSNYGIELLFKLLQSPGQ